MRMGWSAVPVRVCLVCSMVVVFCGPASAQQGGQQGVRVSETKAPDRDGDGIVSVEETGCPPLVGGMKATPDPAKGDADVSAASDPADSAGVLDYFMGEWKFVQGSKDLIVQKWCINRPETPTAFRDHFTYRILTSENGLNTERIIADDEKT